MRNTYTKTISASKLWMLPLLALLAGIFAFTGKASYSSEKNATHVKNAIPVDTPRIKYFGRLEVRKVTGKLKGIALNDVRLFIINGQKYLTTGLGKFQQATLKADEMIITPADNEKAIQLHGAVSANGVIEFKNATITPPMINAKKKPVFLLDGVTVKDLQRVKNLDPNTIREINILKDVEAVTKPGETGLRGYFDMVEILTNAGSGGNASIGEIKVIEQEGIKDEQSIVPPPVDDARVIIEERASEDLNKLYERVEIDASFKGGTAAWMKYLEANLDQKIPKKKKAPAGSYTVWIQFIVNKEGNISDIKALTNHGYGMEEEALRLIKTTITGKWVPGVQNGRLVNSYKKQGITFTVEK